MKKILIIVALALIWGGGQGVYTSVKNPNPVVCDLNELTSGSLPDKEWLTLKNSDLNVVEAAHFETVEGSKASVIYLPLRAAEDAPVVALLATSDTALLEVYNAMADAADDNEMFQLIQENKDVAFQEDQTITGLVRFGIDLDSDEESQLRGAYEDLAENFVIVDHNAKPKTTSSYIMLIAGLGLLVILIAGFFKKRKTEH